MSRRVLIVASSFSPALPANAHRARLLTWCLRKHGWDFEILAPSIEFQHSQWLDPQAETLFPSDVCVHWANLRRSWVSAITPKGIAWRPLSATFRRGNELLASGRFDLIYITTAISNFFLLGSLWRRRYGVPVVLDIHDPWYLPNKNVKTTNHRLKANAANFISRFFERRTMKDVDGLVAVSSDYIEQLRKRYPTANVLRRNVTATIPFGFLPLDLKQCSRANHESEEIGTFTVAYVGVGSRVMQKSFRRIVEGLARLRLRDKTLVDRLRVRLFGTDGGWSEGRPKILQAEANASSVGDLVQEDPRIVPYSTALERALSADALLVLGVDDPAYMPSKLFTYAAMQKPLLACVHLHSQVNSYFLSIPSLGHIIHFGTPRDIELREDATLLDFLRSAAKNEVVARPKMMERYSADAVAIEHARFFEHIVTRST
jgi:hypothetical protein